MLLDGRPTPTEVQLALTLIGVGLTGIALITGYLIHLNRKGLPKTKPEQTHPESTDIFSNGLVEKILTRRTQKSGHVAALTVLEEATEGKNIQKKLIKILQTYSFPQ